MTDAPDGPAGPVAPRPAATVVAAPSGSGRARGVADAPTGDDGLRAGRARLPRWPGRRRRCGSVAGAALGAVGSRGGRCPWRRPRAGAGAGRSRGRDPRAVRGSRRAAGGHGRSARPRGGCPDGPARGRDDLCHDRRRARSPATDRSPDRAVALGDAADPAAPVRRAVLRRGAARRYDGLVRGRRGGRPRLAASGRCAGRHGRGPAGDVAPDEQHPPAAASTSRRSRRSTRGWRRGDSAGSRSRSCRPR